jgi:hypothetical protein
MTKRHEINGFRGNGGNVPYIINPGNRCRRVVKLQLLCPWAKGFQQRLNGCIAVDLARVERERERERERSSSRESNTGGIPQQLVQIGYI